MTLLQLVLYEIILSANTRLLNLLGAYPYKKDHAVQIESGDERFLKKRYFIGHKELQF